MGAEWLPGIGDVCGPDDYVERYGEPEAGPGRLRAVLSDALALVASELVTYAPGDDPALDANVRAVACSVAYRVLSRPADGLSSAQESAGPYSRQVAFANADGAMYLTRSERRRLGADGCAVGCMSLGGAS